MTDRNGWIPVEENLPLAATDVLVQVERSRFDSCVLYTGYLYCGDWYVNELDGEDVCVTGQIMAWMPLPGEYKGEERK